MIQKRSRKFHSCNSLSVLDSCNSFPAEENIADGILGREEDIVSVRFESIDFPIHFDNSHDRKLISGSTLNWTLTDALERNTFNTFNVIDSFIKPIKSLPEEKIKLPLRAFNHISREVLSLEKSKNFYVDILG